MHIHQVSKSSELFPSNFGGSVILILESLGLWDPDRLVRDLDRLVRDLDRLVRDLDRLRRSGSPGGDGGGGGSPPAPLCGDGLLLGPGSGSNNPSSADGLLLGPGSGSGIPASVPDPPLSPGLGATSESVNGEMLLFLSSVLCLQSCTLSVLPRMPGVVFETLARSTASVKPVVCSATSSILSATAWSSL